jgi:hypothetical protein
VDSAPLPYTLSAKEIDAALRPFSAPKEMPLDLVFVAEYTTKNRGCSAEIANFENDLRRNFTLKVSEN